MSLIATPIERISASPKKSTAAMGVERSAPALFQLEVKHSEGQVRGYFRSQSFEALRDISGSG